MSRPAGGPAPRRALAQGRLAQSRLGRGPLGRALRRLRRAFGREEGGATVEFVIVFPLFLTVLLTSVESGLMLARQVMLERALDMAVRDLRLGSWVNPDHDGLRERICARTGILRDCRTDLLLELQPVDATNWILPQDPVACVDREEEIEPVTQFTPGAGNQLMLVRVCYIADPLFPTTRFGLQLPLDASGGFQLRSASAFVNEPR